MLIQEWAKISLKETKVNGEIIDLDECYLEGLKFQNGAFYQFGVSMWAFGIALMGIVVSLDYGKRNKSN